MRQNLTIDEIAAAPGRLHFKAAKVITKMPDLARMLVAETAGYGRNWMPNNEHNISPRLPIMVDVYLEKVAGELEFEIMRDDNTVCMRPNEPAYQRTINHAVKRLGIVAGIQALTAIYEETARLRENGGIGRVFNEEYAAY